MDIYELANEIIDYSDKNPGDFELLLKKDGLEIFVEGYAYVNNLGGEGEITNFEVRRGELSEEDIQEIKDEFYGTVNWS